RRPGLSVQAAAAIATMSSGVTPQQPPITVAPAARHATEPAARSGRGPSTRQARPVASHVEPRLGYATSGRFAPAADARSDGTNPGGVQFTPTATTCGLEA